MSNVYKTIGWWYSRGLLIIIIFTVYCTGYEFKLIIKYYAVVIMIRFAIVLFLNAVLSCCWDDCVSKSC